MQQRYCDPLIGHHFLSTDPVTANIPGGQFNRYWYASANPYRFTDPDGRLPTDPTQAVENSKRKHDTAAQEKAAIAAASDAVGAGGLGVGSVELVLEKEANAWTALAARETGAWAQIVRDGAADISRMAKSFSTVGAASSVLTGSYEGLTSESVAGKGHGWSMATLGAAAGFRLISAPAALGIEAADAIV